LKPILQVKNLNYIYSIGTPFEHKALDNVSFSLERGEFVGIIGHTGSGKSTLMQHLNGLLKPTSGEILLDGQSIWGDKALTRQARFRVGLVFQYPEYQLFEETVYKDIAFGPKNMGLKDKEIDRRVREAAGFVGLTEEQLQVSPFDLSGGQKRRVAIAGVIAMEPEVLILDEPTAGLDPSGRAEILANIVVSKIAQKTNRNLSMTGILVAFNIYVYIAAFFLVDRNGALLSILVYVVATVIIDKFTDRFEAVKQVTIITKKPDKIIAWIRDDMKKTCTVMDSYGAVAGTNKTVICYVTYFELSKLRENIQLLEDTAFITVSTVDEIIR